MLFLVWDEPQPLNVIADELGVTPQAAGQTARLVEQVGYVRLEPNPADRRSKLVVITERGRAVNDERGAAAIRTCEDYYADLIGTESAEQLGTALVALWERLNAPGRSTGLRTLFGILPLVALRLRSQLHTALTLRGHADLKPSHLEALAPLFLDGARASEIARMQGVSRQAIGQTMRELEGLGYVERRPDETDRRGVVFSLSERGGVLAADTVGALQDLRARSSEVLGEARLLQMEEASRHLDLALHVDAAVSKSRLAAQNRDSALASDRTERGDSSVVQLAVRLRETLSPSDVAFLAALLTAQASTPRAASNGD